MKTDINMLLLNIEHFLSDIRGSRYVHLKKVYLFVGHPVSRHKKSLVQKDGWIKEYLDKPQFGTNKFLINKIFGPKICGKKKY